VWRSRTYRYWKSYRHRHPETWLIREMGANGRLLQRDVVKIGGR
jgi:hypothetical protein